MARSSAIQQIMQKLARNCGYVGLTAVQNGNSVTVTNGGNALVVSYVLPVIQQPMGGVDGSVSPFLGIGIANPGQLQITSSTHAAGTIADVIDSAAAAQLLQLVSGFANDIVLSNDNASFTTRLRGSTDWLGMGQ